jgi:hypothetical protein
VTRLRAEPGGDICVFINHNHLCNIGGASGHSLFRWQKAQAALPAVPVLIAGMDQSQSAVTAWTTSSPRRSLVRADLLVHGGRGLG